MACQSGGYVAIGRYFFATCLAACLWFVLLVGLGVLVLYENCCWPAMLSSNSHSPVVAILFPPLFGDPKKQGFCSIWDRVKWQ